jgi:Holliday junction resolvase RusA-like endonuclease
MAHTSRPDLDNLIKTVLDALNGIAYTDDKQIVRLGATKAYGTDPKILISIRAA